MNYNIKSATVINVCEVDDLAQWMENPDNVYIASPNFQLCNPYRVGVDGDRDQVIDRYKWWVADRIASSPATYVPLLRSLKGKTLGCRCHPLPCHGDVLVDLINQF